MKIAILGHKRFASREGGVEVVVTELAQQYAAMGHDVTVYNRKGHHIAGAAYDEAMAPAAEQGVYSGVTIKTVSCVPYRGFAAASASYFAMRAAIKDKPDVIHVHAEGPCATIGMAQRAGIPTVATIHGLDWQRAKWGRFAKKVLLRGERTAAQKADQIIVLSENARQYFEKTYARDTVYIPNGISIPQTQRPAELITRKFGLTKDSYLLSVGRIVPEKGLHHLIKAYRKLETNKPLVIAGSESDSGEYWRYIRGLAAECRNPVVFTGFVFNGLLEELYSNAYLFALPSDLEGMSMSLLEAMSYGKCCVASDIQENSEVLQDSGVYFQAGNVAALQVQLETLLSDEGRVNALGEATRTRAQDAYGWKAIAEQTLQVYEKAITQHIYTR